jgi:hypothetical protein
MIFYAYLRPAWYVDRISMSATTDEFPELGQLKLAFLANAKSFLEAVRDNLLQATFIVAPTDSNETDDIQIDLIQDSSAGRASLVMICPKADLYVYVEVSEGYDPKFVQISYRAGYTDQVKDRECSHSTLIRMSSNSSAHKVSEELCDVAGQYICAKL